MGTLKTICTLIIKLLAFIVFTTLMLIPAVFILGNHSLHQPAWDSSFATMPSLGFDINSIRHSKFTNIYLSSNLLKPSHKNVAELVKLSDFLSYQFNKQNIAVVRVVLPFQEIKKTKKAEGLNMVLQFGNLDARPQYEPLKNFINQYLNFEDTSLQKKQWIILAIDSITREQLKSIKQLKNQYPNDYFLVLSSQKINNKIIDFQWFQYNLQSDENPADQDQFKKSNDKDLKNKKKQKDERKQKSQNNQKGQKGSRNQKEQKRGDLEGNESSITSDKLNEKDGKKSNEKLQQEL